MLNRILGILDALEEEPELTVTEVAGRVGIDKSTASRQLAALARHNYVNRDPVSGRFRLGIRLLRLGEVVRSRINLRSRAMPFMTRLRDVTGETVGLVVRQGPKRVYVEVVDSQQQVRRTHEVGVPQDLYPGGPGKLFLAYMPPAEAAEIIRSAGPIRFGSGAMADPAAVEEAVAAIRTTGVSWSQDERVTGGASAAFPVFDHKGQVVAALTVIMPSSRVTPEHRAYCIEEGRAAAAELSRDLGYVLPRT